MIEALGRERHCSGECHDTSVLGEQGRMNDGLHALLPGLAEKEMPISCLIEQYRCQQATHQSFHETKRRARRMETAAQIQ